MDKDLLTARDLSVWVEEKNTLRSLSLSAKSGETHVLMGPSGAGKLTFGNTLMGNPHYEVVGGSVEFQGQNLLGLPVNERAKAGIFMSFQSPLEVSGINLANFIRNAIEQRTGKHIHLWDFREEIAKALEMPNMDPSYADRDLNMGFSSGGKKKAETLQLLMLKPSLAIFDKTDSGLDMDTIRTVSRGVEEHQKGKDSALTIITYGMDILSSLEVGKAHVLVKGPIVVDDDGSLVEEVNRDGSVKLGSKE